MAVILDITPIFIKQYQISLYIKQVLIIWDSSYFNSLPTYIKIYPVMLRNSKIF